MVNRRHLLANSVFCLLIFSTFGSGQTLTTVRDKVTNPDGSTFAGTLQLTWVGGAGSSISPTTTSAHLYTGVFTALLVPTTTVTPCAYYTAQFTSNDGTSQWTQNWYVPPSSAILTISQITTPNATCTGGGTTVPSAPTNLSAIAASTSQINLTWSANSGSGVTYNVYASTLSTFSPSGGTLIATGLTSASYQSSGLSASTTYYYLVTAMNSSGASLPSNLASATTMTTSGSLPASPAGLAATALSSGQINLSWNASSTTGVTYNVYVSTAAGVTPIVANRIASGLSSTNYQSTGLGASTTYYYVVTAVDSAGESAVSNIANATTQASSSGGSITLPIPVSDVANLSNLLAAKPNIGTSYTPGSAAIIDSSGNIGSVAGNPTNCVLVNGTSAPCASVSLPIQITDVTNLSATLSTLGTEYSTLNSTVSTQGTSISTLQGSVGTLGTTVTSQGTSLTTLTNTVTSQGTSLSNIGSTVSSQGTSLSTLNTTVPALSATVTTMGTNLSTLTATVSTLPVKGVGITSGRTAFIDSSGNLNTISGNASDCVHVDGSTGSCGGGSGGSSVSVSFIDSETPAGTVNGANATFTLAQTPSPATSLEVFRNGILQQVGSDFSLGGNTVTFLTGAVPQTSDTLLAYYRVNGSAQNVNFVDGETPAGTMDGTNTAYTLANVPVGGLRLYKNGALLLLNTDYTISGANVTFINGSQPFPNDALLAYYRH